MVGQTADVSPENLSKLRLARTEGIGPVRYQKWMEKCDDADAALRQIEAKARQKSGKNTKIPTTKEVEAEISALQALNGQFIFWGDENYPPLLANLPDAPIVLSVIGDIDALYEPQIAIVGNRNVSAHGATFSHSLAKELVEAGFGVISGMARGVDTAAHKGALNAKGNTVAVLAGGVDHIYPPENKRLYEEIIKRDGCVVSENPLGMAPLAKHFPRRNRIISGLAYATVVTEASRHSGSLITANYAGDQGREVFAVPGSPADPRAAGPNHLLKQGASLLQSVEDILEVVTPQQQPKAQPKTFYAREESLDLVDDAEIEEVTVPSDAKETVLALLSSAPTAVDDLIRQSGLAEVEVITSLTELDLDGVIVRSGDGRVSLS